MAICWARRHQTAKTGDIPLADARSKSVPYSEIWRILRQLHPELDESRVHGVTCRTFITFTTSAFHEVRHLPLIVGSARSRLSITFRVSDPIADDEMDCYQAEHSLLVTF